MSGDWLSELENEFKSMYAKEEAEARSRLAESLMNMFFGLWLKFDLDRGVRMRLTPFEWEFVEYKGKQQWQVNQDFNFAGVSEVELLDTKFPYPQAIRAELYRVAGSSRVRVVVMLADWREGTRQGFTPYLLYDSPLESARSSDMWKEIKRVVIPWHEAHISNNQEHFWDKIKSDFVELPRN